MMSKPEVGPVPVTVPGSVQMSLLKAGLIEDWNVALNARNCEWIENRDWVYQATIPDEWLEEGARVRLLCSGLDYCGDILLNNQTVASFQNSFVPCAVDLTASLKKSNNVLSIRFTPGPRWLGQIAYTSQINSWKPRFSYGWDWTSRVVQVGVWDNVALEIVRGGEIRSIRCITDFDLTAGKGKLQLSARLVGGTTVHVELADGQRNIRKIEIDAHKLAAEGIDWIDLDVSPWEPNRLGTQSLYDLHLELLDESGRLLDRQSRKLGFKHVEWKRTKGAPTEAEPYLCIVNGKPVFLFGVNWTPIRPNFADVTAEDYRKRIEAYRDCGMNVLRVWGGAFLEKEQFYDLCDAMGLLVWQEFPLSSSGLDNYPPDEAPAILEFQNIVESYIERRQHHASLLLWCGGNELQDDKGGVATPQPSLSIRNHPLLQRAAHIVAQRDPNRRFVATNPLGPVGFFNERDCGKGKFWDVHGPWDFDGRPEQDWQTLWSKGDAMFHSEMGAPSASSASLIRRYRGSLPERPGTADNPLWNRQSWWIEWPKFVSELGREPKDLEEFVSWSQVRQTAALRIAFSAAKARFPACGGMIIWMGHDSFPCTVNTSILDFDGNPKPAFLELAKLTHDESAELGKAMGSWASGQRKQSGSRLHST